MSDLRQPLQELMSEWRKRVVALFPDDLTRRAELERCVSQLDALVRAASPPAPVRWCIFDSIDGVASCGGHLKPFEHTPEGWACRDGLVTFAFGCEFGHISRSATIPAVGPPAPPVDTDVVRGRVDGAAGGVRSAGPPQERIGQSADEAMNDETPEQELARLRIEVADLSHDLKACIERESAGGAAGPQAPPPLDLDGLLKSLASGLYALMMFSGEGVHLHDCNGGEDGPCDCGFIEPHGIIEALQRQVLDAQKSARGDVARVQPSQDSPERLLADWRAQDAALAEIWDELGIDRHVGPSDPAEIAQLTIEALRAARVPPATPQGWQPVETMPYGHSVLVTDGHDVQMTCIHPHSLFPTHWMPLPAAPATPQEK